MIRIDLRLHKRSLNKVQALTRESEGMTQAEVLRELVDLGLLVKQAKEKKGAVTVSPVEKEILMLLYRTLYVSNYTFQQTFNGKPLPVDSPVEGVKKCMEDARGSVLRQMEDWQTHRSE